MVGLSRLEQLGRRHIASQAREYEGPPMTSTDQLDQVPNATVYLDDTTGDPSWITVKTGLFGTNEGSRR